MNLLTLQQGSPEWLEARLGNCTGSRVKDALSFLKRAAKGAERGEPSQKRKDYMTDIIAERLTGRMVEHYVTPAMQWGIDNERYARAAYEVVSGNDVDTIGIAAHPTIEGFMSSPDGYVGAVGIWEGKCPETTTHLEWLEADVVPAEHELQLISELACSPGREWVDFTSFDPRLPANLQVFNKRMERDEKRIAEVEEGVTQFLAEIAERIAKLQARSYSLPPVMPTRDIMQDPELGITDADIDGWFASQGMERTQP